MPKFNVDSPIGSRTFASQPLQEFNVPDESQHHYDEQTASPPPPLRRRQIDAIPNMSEINNFQNRLDQQQSLDYNHVERPMERPSDVENEIREARALKDAKLRGRERLNEGAKKRIEMLIGMTRTQREVDLLGGNIFILQTLRSKEMREAIMAAAEFDNTVQSPFEIRRQLLARSLVQVAGVDVVSFCGADTLEARLNMVDNLDEQLANRLFDEYSLLVKDAQGKFAIKDDATAQEVVEDLKK